MTESNSSSENILSEVFEINPESVPFLSAYALILEGKDRSKVGGKLAYQFSKKLGRHWVWTGRYVVTDRATTESEIDALVRKLRRGRPEVYKHLEGLRSIEGYRPTSADLAKVVAFALVRDHEPMLRRILNKYRVDLGPAFIDRVYDITPLVVRNTPCVSVSVSSRLVLKRDAQECAANNGPEQLVGRFVADKYSSFKGEVTDVVGTLGRHRDRLLDLTTNERTRRTLLESPDDVWVLRVGREQYDYAATCLNVVLMMDYMHEFGVDRSKAQRRLRIPPPVRWKTVLRLARFLRMKKLIQSEYNSLRRPEAFINFSALRVDTSVLLGDGECVPHGSDIMRQLGKHGLYRIEDEYATGRPIRIGVVRSRGARALSPFLKRVENEMSSIGLAVEYVGEDVLSGDSRHELEVTVDHLIGEGADFILGVFEDCPNYYQFKQLTVGRGVGSQVILDKTLDKPFSMANIILGISGKTGSIPYVLAQPLEYADLVVGIDIARRRKAQREGSVNVAAVARIYFSNGEFMRYVIHDEPIEGETLPPSVLRNMFPAADFTGKRVVIHRDGPWRGDEKQILYDWARELKATFHLVEVIKSGAPRLYSFGAFDSEPRDVGQPAKGSTLKLNSHEAIIASTPPPSDNATTQPLRVRSGPTLPIEKALHSVMALTLLHYGSVRETRLPVTVHYSDKIAGLALNGVKPRELSGTRLYWL